jgi:hypothetical protein
MTALARDPLCAAFAGKWAELLNRRAACAIPRALSSNSGRRPFAPQPPTLTPPHRQRLLRAGKD